MQTRSFNLFRNQGPGASANGCTRAFSLLELVVVLAILAALATVALRAVSSTQNQSRYQQTTATLGNIRDAIVGPANQRNPDGTPFVTGFVADTGQLPGSLDDLTSGINNFGPLSTSDPAITIYGGRQGPYVRLGVGTGTLADGWGNPFNLYDGTTGSPGPTLIPPSSQPIAQITSWGVDKKADPYDPVAGTGYNGGNGDTTGYNADVGIKLGSPGGVAYQAAFTGRIRVLDTSGNPVLFPISTWASNSSLVIYVVYFGPNGGAVVETSIPVSLTTGQFTIAAGTIGPRVLRAYVVTPSTTPWGPGVASTAIAKSAPMNIVAVGGGQTVPDLVIGGYTP